MRHIALTQFQIDLVAKACDTAVNEDARFLDDNVRLNLGYALRAMGKVHEANVIDPG